ncbi:MAG: NAD(P)-dependent oxidoreductase [Acidobacteria bacterium]|nr:NAD(P)-dependent oxidoreductase [Acidobacteriota bacterium]MBI3425500.1 NAD(P)-dependent oxidoreductase [Acidobacteriota bacterium]
MQIGFIGLGIMGQPMARNLLKAGFPLVVATRTPGKAANFADENATLGRVQAAATPAQVAALCDVIIVMVTDTPDVVEVAYGETGLFATAKPGTIIIDMSTISPSVTRDLATKANKQGLHWLDAPVSGGEKGAIEGTLTIMAGGAAEAVAQAQPVLNAMGKRITHFGAPGNGQSAKLCNQIMVAVNLMAVCETMTFARKAGLDLNLLHQALTGGAANSWALDVLGKKMIDRDFKPAFMVKLQQKDLRLVMDAANSNHSALPAAGLAHQMLAAVEAEGRGEDGTQSLVRIFERLAGLAE